MPLRNVYEWSILSIITRDLMWDRITCIFNVEFDARRRGAINISFPGCGTIGTVQSHPWGDIRVGLRGFQPRRALKMYRLRMPNTKDFIIVYCSEIHLRVTRAKRHSCVALLDCLILYWF
jgi:hypothetical protein